MSMQTGNRVVAALAAARPLEWQSALVISHPTWDPSHEARWNGWTSFPFLLYQDAQDPGNQNSLAAWLMYKPTTTWPSAPNPHGTIVQLGNASAQVAFDNGPIAWVDLSILTLE